MLKIGITGGIGAGKTIVSNLFKTLGAPVYNADQAARRLMESSTEIITSIKKLFGDNAYLPEGKLNNQYLSSIVFSNKELLEQLNAIVHPATIEDADKWMQQQHAPYVIKEAALMYESTAFHYLDAIVLVYAPVSLRILRTTKRDHAKREEVLKRINQQMDENIKMLLADYIIYNDEQQMIIPQVLELHRQFIKQATPS
jgi:dephospho-CoA kinase